MLLSSIANSFSIFKRAVSAANVESIIRLLKGLFWHRLVQNKSQNRIRMPLHRLKGHQTPPESGVATVSSDTLLLVVCSYTTRPVPLFFKYFFVTVF